MNHSAQHALLLTIGMAPVLIVGCASTPPPTEQVAVANAALAHAVRAGTADLAGPEMRIASDKMDRVRAAMTAKDFRHAAWLAQEAQLDAQAAEVKAAAVKSQRAADALRDDNEGLRDELDRKIK